MRKIGIILNEKAGKTDPYEEIKALAESLPATEYEIDIKYCSNSVEIMSETRRYVKEEFDTVIAAGGDGTVNTVAECILKTDTNLGILPVGTLNHLAKDLKLPLSTNEAFNIIIEKPHVLKIDVGRCNDKIFLNNSGLGIYPRIVELREKFRRGGYVKGRAFWMAIFQAIKKIPQIYVELKVGDTEIKKKTSFVFVGNNIYGLGGFATGTRQSMVDGKLSVWISHRTSLFGLIELFFHAFFGNVKEHEDFDVFEVESLCVETKKRKTYVSFDGEIERLESPLKYRIDPQILNIIVSKPLEPAPMTP